MADKLVGIYSITCTKTNCLYVGQSTDITTRWNQHIFKLIKKTHNHNFQKDFDTYGLESFNLRVLEVVKVPTKENLERIEQKWIKKLKPSYNAMINSSSTVANSTFISELFNKQSAGANYGRHEELSLYKFHNLFINKEISWYNFVCSMYELNLLQKSDKGSVVKQDSALASMEYSYTSTRKTDMGEEKNEVILTKNGYKYLISIMKQFESEWICSVNKDRVKKS